MTPLTHNHIHDGYLSWLNTDNSVAVSATQLCLLVSSQIRDIGKILKMGSNLTILSSIYYYNKIHGTVTWISLRIFVILIYG